jgi:hypothetical protein
VAREEALERKVYSLNITLRKYPIQSQNAHLYLSTPRRGGRREKKIEKTAMMMMIIIIITVMEEKEEYKRQEKKMTIN